MHKNANEKIVLFKVIIQYTDSTVDVLEKIEQHALLVINWLAIQTVYSE